MYSRKHCNTLIRNLLAISLTVLLGACGGNSGSVTGTTGTTTTSSTGSTTSSPKSSTSSTASSTATGKISLSWTAPVSRTDGTPLSMSEIAGYRVHYGTSPGKYPNHVNITNGSLQSATVTGVPVGTYYVAMSTYDASGLESSYSAAIVKQAL